jgi:uncharacterized protein
VTVTQVETSQGPAEVRVEGPGSRRGLLVLGHGAGGGPDAPDLVTARDAAVDAGWACARVTQPWRVAGKRVAAPPPRLDEAWLAVLAALPAEGPVVLGGRSAGARVACRTADAVAADHDLRAVLCLAFPLHPPGRPERSRLAELRLPAVPRLVVQGDRDAFGLPQPEPGVAVAVVAGADHAFRVRRADGRSTAEALADVRAAVTGLLQTLT